MRRILLLIVTRRLARTPLGLVVLGLGWLFARRRRARRRQPADVPAPRAPGRRPGAPYARNDSVAGDRR
ncbi:hypothetical protein GCM10010116_08270 [Microbispora rosea subsp. aerata]|nr:DUF6203 family protein [Microbispora rosea]GGO04198.1 hypothetical protein GCM10010116_08270 [Microbispora rosea subsp. aerata]GIH54958.1 hypothetical protein Mro02_18720 [Microbispora rosea subsp. aerata]GLJ82972.1 hypothetical protein GCM10017588_16980 [Microbispora rosea subsp. aerata]